MAPRGAQFPNVAIYWGRVRRRAFCDFNSRNRILFSRWQIPPREKPAVPISKGRRRLIKRRAADAIGVVSAQAARYNESLSPQPAGPTKGAAREPCASTDTSP